ncbi:secretin N-terminal domain-containing protein [Planctomycetes bacterium K23_9]
MPADPATHTQVSHVVSAAAKQTDAPQVKKLRAPASQVTEIATALSLRYSGLADVQISPDVRNQTLIVMAPQSVQPKIAQQVVDMLTASGVRKSAMQMQGGIQVDLAHIGWRQFEQALQAADGGGTPVTTSRNGQSATYQLMSETLQGTTIHVSRETNSIRIETPAASAQAWQKLVGYLDQSPTRSDELVQVVRMVNAEQAPVQRAVYLLHNLNDGSSPQAKAPSRRGNPMFRTAAFQQDSGPGGDAGPAPADGEDGGSGVIGDAQIQFVPELGQIIVRGTKRDVDRIKAVIDDIEKASVLTQPKVDIVKLSHADANAVATLLSQLYEDVLSTRQGEVSITSLDSPNALLLIGREEAIAALKDLIAKIDKPVEAESRLRVFRLQNASAADAEATINGFFVDQPTAGGGGDQRPGIGPRVRVLADYRTNSLVISAAPRDMTEVTRLINDLDVQDIEATNQIKVFPLNNAAAEDLAETLQEAINGDGEGGNDNLTPASTSLSIVALDTDGNRIVSSGILAGATVTADTGANAIVVRAPAPSMSLIAELIRQLDKAPGIDSLVKVFTIENGDAQQLTTALSTLFGDEAATSGTTIGAGNTAGLPPTTASAESTLVPLRFSPDIRTNSIIASGSAADLEVVESILLRLDSEGFAERITEVIWLRHNDATVISDAVTNYVTSRRQSQSNITQYQAGLGPYDLVDRDLIVVPEVNSNSLLLSVSPRMYEDVRRLIDRLDRRRPMVLIKVMLAEVTLDDTFEIGGELGLQDSLVFDRGLGVANAPGSVAAGTPGFNFNNAGVNNVNTTSRGTLAAGGMSAFGLGTTNSAIGYGGFVLNAASESVSLLMRTLHEANRLQILSRPQVMTMDNTPSLIRVGRKVARVTDIVNNGNAGTQVVTEDIDVGLILQVTPRVGADGLITMNVDITRSARDTANGTFVPTGDGGTVFIDDIIDTTAQSTLTAYTGQTVVFGGLIQKSRGNISRRVPVMADIPLLGNLFKYDTETETRNELLVVMTPMLINGDQDLDYVKKVESSRMSWCLADVVEAHGDVGLSGGYGLWGPAVGNTIYPDIHPTVANEVVVSDQPLHGGANGSQIINDPTGQFGSGTATGEVIPSYDAMPQSNSVVNPGMDAGLIDQAPVSVEQFRSAPAVSSPESLPTPGPATAPNFTDGASMSPANSRTANAQPVDSGQSPLMQVSFAGSPQDKTSTKPSSHNANALWWDNGATDTTALASASEPATQAAPTAWNGQAVENTTEQSKKFFPTPKWQSSKTEAPASESSASTLLPAISPRSWIR